MHAAELADLLAAETRALEQLGEGSLRRVAPALDAAAGWIRRLQDAPDEQLHLLAEEAAEALEGAATMVLGHVDSDAPLADLREASRAAAELAGQLRLYAGRIPDPDCDVDAAALARELVPELEQMLSDGVGLEVGADGRGWVAMGPDPLARVLSHLVANAARATAEGGVAVSVRSGRDGESEERFVQIAVRDTGSGMDDATARAARRPLFTTHPDAMGMGLAVVDGVARAHGGSVAIDTAPGRGAAVTLRLPAAARAETVLVVDDEPMILEVAQTMLRRGGFRVLVASDGEQALRIYERDPQAVDVVVLDLTMPGMTGEETLRALHEVDSGVCVVVCSGYAVDDTVAGIGDAMVAGYLQKPYGVRELCRAVRSALDDREGS